LCDQQVTSQKSVAAAGIVLTKLPTKSYQPRLLSHPEHWNDVTGADHYRI